MDDSSALPQDQEASRVLLTYVRVQAYLLLSTKESRVGTGKTAQSGKCLHCKH